MRWLSSPHAEKPFWTHHGLIASSSYNQTIFGSVEGQTQGIMHACQAIPSAVLAFVLSAGQEWLEENTSWEVVALKTNLRQGIAAPPSCHAVYILFDTRPCHMSRKPTCKYYIASAFLDFFLLRQTGSHSAVQPGLWTLCSPVCPWRQWSSCLSLLGVGIYRHK